MSDRIDITVFENGPYKVSGATRVNYCGEAVQAEGDLFICRCGSSKNAPFCDGTHRAEGFDDTNPPPRTKDVVVWEGRTVRTRFNPNTCMHAYYCQPLKALRERELAGDDAAAEEIMRVVSTCPSGALSFESKGAPEPAALQHEVQVDIMEGGELRIQAPHDINAERMEGQDEVRSTLCRCGLSKNKPWCDGRHKTRAGFR